MIYVVKLNQDGSMNCTAEQKAYPRTAPKQQRIPCPGRLPRDMASQNACLQHNIRSSPAMTTTRWSEETAWQSLPGHIILSNKHTAALPHNDWAFNQRFRIFRV
jgi:hypothetical protein